MEDENLSGPCRNTGFAISISHCNLKLQPTEINLSSAFNMIIYLLSYNFQKKSYQGNKVRKKLFLQNNTSTKAT